jgi:uncharacterized membrane protein YgdD (TMEM256/DUF423 family)
VNPKTWLVSGALLAGIAVAAGSYSAHGLEDRLKEAGRSEEDLARDLENFDTATRYEMTHALAILVVGAVGMVRPAVRWHLAGWCFLLGIVFFSGTLYLIVFTGVKDLSVIVPAGGAAFLVGWLVLAVGAAMLRATPKAT